ncbi:bifunctional tRNA (5-methylaminomethyl-2-thiouridine)(34)-methyltransferase MnmD/FAD-dependent 5-carboxymethylaminomethyl-2-thiouridine(34) oxidoreductase MnmC [Endozoicomonadaceae bacterium StTr2]
MPQIESAGIEWRSSGQPVSTRFDDVYFSIDDGLEESRHVFLKHNGLPERFIRLESDQCFTIVETGFGTGLNFLCCWQSFIQHAPASARLHFISTEKYPLTQPELQKALQLWPELEPRSKQLTAAIPVSKTGFHTLSFDQGRIRLTLLLGDMQETLPQLNATVDAWFLDGFAPAKNPGMWQPELYQQMSALSHKATTYSTFTAARAVREGLAEAGFIVQKVPGFGHKRDMICGVLETPASEIADTSVPVWLRPKAAETTEKKAIVIGGGLSGTASARALAERGWQVTLLEQKPQLAAGASGNPQGMLYVRLSHDNTVLSRFCEAGYQHAIHRVSQLLADKPERFSLCGVIQLASSDKAQQKQQRLAEAGFPSELLQAMSSDELSELAGISLDKPGLWFPGGGWVHPPAVCNALADHNNITVITDCTVNSLERKENEWLLETNQGVMRAPVVVVASADKACQFSQLAHLPLKPIRGQVSTLPATTESRKLKTVLCGDSYAAPESHNQHTFGATFNFREETPEIRAEDHQENLNQLERLSPSLFEALDAQPEKINSGRVGFRCTTPDYLPLVGPVADYEQFDLDFAMLRKNARFPFRQQPNYHEGLYINSGHGSRGLITCLLSGELLAAMISGEALPIASNIASQLHPTRFQARIMIRS